MKIFLSFFLLSAIFAISPQTTLQGIESSSAQPFQITDGEIAEASQWGVGFKTRLDAGKKLCERAALYQIGDYYLYCDVVDAGRIANEYFSQSASFGYPPAVVELVKKNINEGNVYLSMVYIKLVILLGHEESLASYNYLKQMIMEYYSSDIIEEIEHLAAEKAELILRNQKKIVVTEDRKALYESLESAEMLVDQRDSALKKRVSLDLGPLETQLSAEWLPLERLSRNFF